MQNDNVKFKIIKYDFGSSAGLRIMDVSNPDAPFSAAAILTGGAGRGVAYSNGYAFVADSGAGLSVIDVRDPYNPVLVNQWTGGVPPSQLTLQKTTDRQEVLKNQYITYTMSYTNNQGDLSNVKIEDPLDLTHLDPASVQFLSGNGSCDTGTCNSSSTKVIFDIGSVANNSTGSVSFKIRVK